jgi:hypothetical protein
MNEVPPEFFFLFLFGARSQFDWPITQKNLTMKAPQNKRFYFEVHIFLPAAHLLSAKGGQHLPKHMG